MRGIARTVREDHAVRLRREDLVRTRVVRDPHNVCVSLRLADDVSLHAAVDDDDRALPVARVPFGGSTAHLSDEVAGVGMRRPSELLCDLGDVLRPVGESRFQRPVGSDPDGQRTRVRPFHRGGLVPPQEFGEGHRALRMARGPTRLPDDEPGGLDRIGFHGVRIDAVIPDERIRHQENLSSIRRIREGFCVARHVGVEHEFAEDRASCPEKGPPDRGSVLEDEGAVHSSRPRPHFRCAI